MLRLHTVLSFSTFSCTFLFTAACEANEQSLQCDNYRLPEPVCPNVEAKRCLADQYRCGCGQRYYRNKDRDCVIYADCVNREADLEKLLGGNHELIMIGASSDFVSFRKTRCFQSTFVSNSDRVYRGHITYWYWNARKVTWKIMELMTTFNVGKHYSETYLYAVNVSTKGGGTTEDLKALHEKIYILHASYNCIITAHTRSRLEWPRCTYWMQKTQLGSRNWVCDFHFNHSCHKKEYYDVKSLTTECKKWETGTRGRIRL